MERQQMIHMACEGVLIGGLSLYFTKQLKKQAKEIEELKEAISKNQAANEKRFEVIFNFLDNVNGGFMPPQQAPQPREAPQRPPREVKKSPPPREEEMKRLPQKKKSVVQTVEEPSVLAIITKKNVAKEDMNIEVCDPNDEDCLEDIKDEMALLEGEEVIEESVDTDMD